MLTKDKIFQWKEQGYTVSNNIINKKLLVKCSNFMKKKYFDEKSSCKDFGSNGQLNFPSGNITDYLTIDENLTNCVKQLLGTDKILLTQSDAWSKYGTEDKSAMRNTDQRIHMDYGNHTFLHPSSWDEPEVVAVIIYLSNTNITGGSTAVVPREGENDILYKPPFINMPGQNKFKFYNDKNHAEEYIKSIDPDVGKFREKLYQREIKVKANIGDILFYRLDTWHRGTPVKKGHLRYVVNIAWKKKECFWINTWNPGWTQRMYYGIIEKLFTEMTPKQREILGVPGVGDPYWNEKKLKYLKFRYPNINLLPYFSKL